MIKLGLSALLFLTTIFSVNAKQNPRVIMKTNFGEVEIELFQSKAPVTVNNFLNYVDKKFYDGTIFHRVIDNFMIQGGGFTKDLKRKSTEGAIKNEASNGLANEVGTLAMARTSDPNSATAQFFINVVNNSYLNYRDSTLRGAGYAVFGKVVPTKGMSVVNRIKQVKTTHNPPFQNLPAEHVVIESIRRKK